MKRRLLGIVVCALSLPSLAAEGWCASPQSRLTANAGEDGQVAKRVADLLKTGTWCHKNHSPVGFVLNYFDFDDHGFQINDRYVSDEGTVMKDVVFRGSWSLAANADIATVHFEITDASDTEVPRPKDLNLRMLASGALAYRNGDKLTRQERNTRDLCF